MQRIDGYYLYQLGHRLHKISEIRVQFFAEQDGCTTKKSGAYELRDSAEALETFLNSSVFDLRIVRGPADVLLSSIGTFLMLCDASESEDEMIRYEDFSPVSTAHREFEAVLKAELNRTGIFLVRSKNAMDTMTLIEAGEEAFPPSLSEKVPEAVPDVQGAMSCIAFELATAAAFHLHRANEAMRQ